MPMHQISIVVIYSGVAHVFTDGLPYRTGAYTMQREPTNYFEWTQRFVAEEACMEELMRLRWDYGFNCPKCGQELARKLKRGLHQCANCRN